MKLAILLEAVSSLQAYSNDLSRFNDRKYGTWKARYNKNLVRGLVNIS
ncbi:MAG: hypothetical protein ACRC30_17115 [Clostridium sp.]